MGLFIKILMVPVVSVYLMGNSIYYYCSGVLEYESTEECYCEYCIEEDCV